MAAGRAGGVPGSPAARREAVAGSAVGRLREDPWPFLVPAVAVLLYLRCLGHDLVWDDLLLRDFIGSRVSRGGVLSLLGSPFVLDPSEPTGYYRPLVLLSLWFDGLISAVVPFSHHLTNILLNGANAFLLFGLFRRLTGSGAAAGVGALLFAVHPVHVESVAFVSGRTDLWAAFFVLLSTTLWFGGDRPAAQGGSALAFLLALLSKEVAVALPAVLLAWDALGVRPVGEDRSWLRRNGRFLVLWAACIAVAVALRVGVAGVGFAGGAVKFRGAHAAAGASFLGMLPGILGTYLRLVVFPWPLSAFYDLGRLGPGWHAVPALLAIGALVAASALRGGGRTGLAGLAWFAGFLAPATAFYLGGAVVAERFLYLPSAGICLAAAGAVAGVAAPGARGRRAAAWSACAVLLLFSALSFTRIAVWRDEPSLFGSILAADPASELALSNLGLAHYREGRYGEALRHFEKARELKPSSARVHTNLGLAYFRAGRYPEAAGAFRQALSLSPRNPAALTGLGESLGAMGRYGEASDAFLQAIAADPSHSQAWYDLGIARSMQGDRAGALDAYRTLSRLDREWADRLGKVIGASP